MLYADYRHYREVFGGSIVPEDKFRRCVSLAGKYIDRFTFGRINDPSSVDGLAGCACEMAEAVYEVKYRDGEKAVKSESTDGYSVTYLTERKDGEDADAFLGRKLYGICSLYLMGTGAMSRVLRC